MGKQPWWKRGGPCIQHLIALALGLASGALPNAVAQPVEAAVAATFRTDRILVKPAAAVDAASWGQLQARLGTRSERRLSRITRAELIRLPPGLPVARALELFRQSGAVEWAEPDYIIRAAARPNDFRYPDQWNMNNAGIYGGTPGADVDAERGWDLQREAPGIIVAVIDSGVRYSHEDLAPNMWVNPGESGLDFLGRDKRANGLDDDGNGYIDDVHGINAILGTGLPLDDWGHGTHVAGIVGAAGNNGLGVAGVAWKVQLLACKFIDSSGNATVSDAITSLDYAHINGARVINASWGGYTFTSAALREAFIRLRDAGIIVTAAAGNNNNNNDSMPLYPASYEFDNIVSVAATDRVDARAGWSNYGPTTVDLGAPGAPVFSTWGGSDQDYQYYDGTSMAAPHVAGAAALLWTRFPGDTYQQVIQRILSTVDPLPSLSGVTKAGGRLNIASALTAGVPPPPPPPPKSPPTARATASPTSGVAPLAVTFSGQASSDTDGVVVSHQWDFKNGSTSTEVNPTTTFSQPGSYAVTLTVTDNDGLSHTTGLTISVTAANQPPVAAASANPTSGPAPLTVAFSGSGSDSDGQITAYRWDFGDGTSATTASASKTYGNAGNYSAMLTVTDDRGAQSTSSVSISVTANRDRDVDVRQFAVETTLAPNGKTATAVVRITDRLDRPVAGVTVTLRFAGLVSSTTSARTDVLGVARFTSPRSKKSGTVTATITAVAPVTGVYDPAIYAEPVARTVSF